MDIYDRLMKLPTTGLTILEILADNAPKKWLMIRELADACDDKISNGPTDLQTLEAFRSLLCYEYRFLTSTASDVALCKPKVSRPIDLAKFIVKATGYSPDSEELSLLYDIMTLQLALRWDEKQFAHSSQSFQVMHKEHRETGNPSAGSCMRAFECFADAYYLRSRLCAVENGEKEGQEMLDCMLKVMEVWMNQEGNVEWKSLASLLPKLVSIFGVHRIIAPLWSNVLGDGVDLSRSLAILCVTADVCFPAEGTGETYYKRCVADEFWTVLLRGLVSGIYQQRKQALYLVKRALDHIESQRSPRAELQPPKATLLPFVRRAEVVDERAANATKRNFFLILESLEEKQKHLVLPVLTHLPDLIDASFGPKSRSFTFNVAWLRCVFKRILQHDNTAVMIHGLREILTADLALYDEDLMNFLVDSLNNVRLYERDEISEQPPEVVTQLVEFFVRSDAAQVPLINTFVRAVSIVSWCPVAICWILRALVEVTKRRAIVGNFWGPEELKCAKNLVEKNLTKHDKTLQSRSQRLILQAFCAYTEANTCWPDVKLVTDTLILVHECRRDPGARWIETVAKHVSRIVNPADAQSYVARNCEELLDSGMSVESHAETIVLLLEANLILNGKDCLAERSLRRLFQNLNGASLRPYADAALIVKILELVGHLMRASNLSEYGKIIDRLVSPYLDATLRLIEKSFEKAEITNCHEYLTAMDAFIGYGYCQNSDDLTQRLKSLRDKCMTVVVEPKKSTKQRWLYTLMALNLYLRANSVYGIELSKMDLPSALRYFKDNVSNHPEGDGSKGRHAWDCCENIAFLILRYIEHADLSLQPEYSWLEDCQLLVQTGTERVIAPVATILLHLLNRFPCLIVENIDKVASLVRLSWQSAFQLNKTEVFFDAITNLTRLMVHPGFRKFDSLEEFAIQCMDQLMEEGKKVPSLRHIFTRVMLSGPRQNVIHYVKPLVCCLLHGEIPRHDQNIERAAISYFEKNDRNFAGATSNRIRAQSVFILLAILNEKGNENFRVNVLRDNLSILEKHRNKRYFDNSHVHRLKHRVMQTLLILEPYLSEAERRELYAATCDLLIAESNQPSVRLMQEWLLVRIYGNSLRQDSVWTLLETAVEKRPGSVISVASIVYHVSRLLEGDTKIEFIGKAMERLLPNCMCQQFNVRLYSQVILVKLFEMLPENHRRRYQHIYEGIQESLRHGNSMKISPRIMDDFYFTVFHPTNDYNFEMIYHQLPRLTGLPVDEWLTGSVMCSIPELGDTGSFLKQASRPGDPTYTDWTTITATKQTSRATGDLAEETDHSANSGLSDIQKKIIPWKSMAPFSDQLSEMSKAALSRKNLRLDYEAGIIVVASLIDRPPNLGGLARTCEIFGARELVIGSLRYTEDREFQTLSVSAEKWITITEVKPHLLKNYLLEQRAKGWKLVGAEQTANSTNLLEMEFDKKTILLLGNEKDGIPANLIPILDTCVEIPQNGVVRSLNVHVTGAICVWQYMKQHVLT